MEARPERSEKLPRPRVEALDEILGKPFKVLDDGLIRVVDYMGDDAAVVQAARVSYGAGTKKSSDDRGLIRYLLRHRHTTPFEMCSIKFHVRVPMDAWRQWIRHRTACLAEGTEIYFDLPGGIERRGNQLYKIKIEDIWNKFQATSNTQRPDKQRDPYHKRDRVKGMCLRHLNEESGMLSHTRIVDVFRNGPRPVFRYTLADGKSIEATADHKFLFAEGWSTFRETVNLVERKGVATWDRGDAYLHVNGLALEKPASYMDREWLDHRYNVQEWKIQDIADHCGVTYHTIRKWIRIHGIQHAKGGRSKDPWIKPTTTRLVKVVDIEYVGIKETYDLEVQGPHHNFIANGIVTHNSVNETSTRYSIAIEGTQKTAPDQWRIQATDNKQGSSGWLDPEAGVDFTQKEAHFHDSARALYNERLEAGIAREQARKDLPLCTYTEAYWKMDLHNLLHFLSLRMDRHAQLEIREYANVIGQEIVARWVPHVWEAFQDYRMGAVFFSRIEHEIIAAIGAGDLEQAAAIARESGWLKIGKSGKVLRNRERQELEVKLESLNLAVPWR